MMELDNPEQLPVPHKGVPLPNMCVAESHLTREKVKLTNHQFHEPLGNRHVKDHSQFASTFGNFEVVDHGETPLSLGDIVNRTKGRCGKKSRCPRHAGHTICVGIGCNNGTSPLLDVR